MENLRNYKLIQTRFNIDSFHLYSVDDKCLFKKNGKIKGVQYYKCIDKNKTDEKPCEVTGKVIGQKFVRLKKTINIHSHEDHSIQAEAEEVKMNIKEDVSKSSTPISSIFFNHTKR